MASQNLEMDDLFDNEVGVDDDLEDIGAAPMPGMDDEAEEAPMNEGGEDGDDEDGEGGDVLAKLRALKKGAAKKRVMRPQPKLNADRLKSERGIPVLPKMFENVTFKGKGHEASDLKLMMSKLEHWGHRLFPKCTFDEFIGRMEKLGQKKDVQTCLKRVRLDMPLLNEFVSPNQYDDDDDADNETQAANQNEVEDMDAEEAYDEMIRQERQAMERRKQQQREEEEELDEDDLMTSQTPSRPSSNKQTTPVSSADKNPVPVTPTTNTGNTPALPHGMTPEQQERLERNKRMALEKRAARLGVPVAQLLPKPQAEATSPDEKADDTSSKQSQENATKSASDNVSSQNPADSKANKNNTNDINPIQDEILKGSDSDEGTETAGKPKSDSNSESAELHLQLSESEATAKGASEGVGNLKLSCTESDTEGVGTLRLNNTDDDKVDNTETSQENDTRETVITDHAQSDENEIDTSEKDQLSIAINNEVNYTENDDVDKTSIAVTETDRIGDSGAKASDQTNTDAYDDIEPAIIEEVSGKNKMADKSADMSEEDAGLCLQLSDSTNTTQEDEELENAQS